MNSTEEVLKKIHELESKHKLPFFNCHTHIFNFEHVHDRFLRGLIPWWVRIILILIDLSIIWLVFKIPARPIAWVVLIIISPILYFMIFGLSIKRLEIHRLLGSDILRKITGILKIMIPGEYDLLDRYANFILHSYDTVRGEVKSQEKIFNEMQSYYPYGTKFIVLSMDLDYMINCDKPWKVSNYSTQLEELKRIKEKNKYKNIIYPFIHADPRRLESSKGKYFKELTDYIQTGIFQGIKIYPALGYFPFDRRLKPVYDLAYKEKIPILAHCSIGPVYYRGKIKTLRKDGYFENGSFNHPFTHNSLEGKSPKSFTPHYTHPLNYYCLLNEPEKLFQYWKKCESLNIKTSYDPEGEKYGIEDLKKYRELKICLGHYGSSEEWLRYLKDPWIPTGKNSLAVDTNLFHDPHGSWKYKESNENLKNIKPYSWYSIITDMLTLKDNDNQLLFPNLYADISYDLCNEEMYPLLKVRLNNNQVLAKKILFGTDFYMVSTNATEREITLKLRSFIGEKNFKQIAVLNPLDFLSSLKTKTITLLN